MAEYDSDTRGVFETAATALYEALVNEGGFAADDPRLAEGSTSRPAFELLVELGLVQPGGTGGRWLPEDPSTVQSRVVAPMSQEGSRLLVESSEWSKAFGGLASTFRRSPLAQARGPFTYLSGWKAIDTFLAGLVAETEEEMLTAQPQTGRDAEATGAASPRDVAMLERGVRMRTLYQHSARRSPFTRKYVASVADLGAEARTLDEFFNRLIVADRRVAVIPAGDDLTSAVAVREPSVVAFLADLFERSWDRARPFDDRGTSLQRDIAAEQRAMTIRMLIQGHSDPVSAKRLGVSPRTYAGYVAELKQEYDAESRFQLGYTMGQAGISGEETT